MDDAGDGRGGDDRKKPDKNRSDRGARGRFVAGNRANPAGRPRGRQNRATELIAELLAGEAESLTRALIRRAKAGNAAALGLIFARLAPAPKDRPIPMALPTLATLADIAAAEDVILDHLAGGTITPSEAQVMSSLVDRKRQVLESLELEARLAALERRLGNHATEGKQRR